MSQNVMPLDFIVKMFPYSNKGRGFCNYSTNIQGNLPYFNKKFFFQNWCFEHTSLIPDTWEVRVTVLRIQGQPDLYSKFKTSLGNLVRPCLLNKVWGFLYFFSK